MYDFTKATSQTFLIDLSRKPELMAQMKEITGWERLVENNRTSAAMIYPALYRRAETCRHAHRLLVLIADELKTNITLPDGAIAGPTVKELTRHDN